MSSYSYQPLPFERSIRILQLENAVGHDEELRGSLVTTVLEEAPDFTALSYVWGSSDLTARIRVDNQTIGITANLNAALKRFRRADAPILIWADGICIDQKNIPERNSQVKLMPDLYRRARKTVAWIGDGDKDTADAMSELLEIADSATKFGSSPRGIRHPFEPGTINIPDSDALALIQKAEAKGVQGIYERPWFTRVWVIQESILSQNLTLVCGDAELDWYVFAAATALIFDAGARLAPRYVVPMLRVADNAFELVLARNDKELLGTGTGVHLEDNPYPSDLGMNIHIVNSVLNQFDTVINHGGGTVQPNHSTVFWRMVWKFRCWHCSDDRDRVIGMMGFLPWDVPIKFAPDYSKTVVEVYTEFARAFLAIQSIDILMFAGIRDRAPYVSSSDSQSAEIYNDVCPSWVPELRLSKLKDHSSASWQHPMDTFLNIRNTESTSSRELVLEGSIMGIVRAAVWLTGPFSMEELIRCLQVAWETYREIAPGENYVLTEEDHIEAFTKTLCILPPANEGESLSFQSPEAISKVQELLDQGDAILAHLDAVLGDVDHRRPPQSEADKSMARLLNHLLETFSKYTFFVTNDGYLGLLPGAGDRNAIKPHDEPVIFSGFGAIFLVRPTTAPPEGKVCGQLISHCYLHGSINMELEDAKASGWITLV